jgi:ribonuclease HII
LREKLYEKIISNAEYKIVVFSANDVDKMGLSACLRKGLDEIVAYFKDKFDVNLEANLKYNTQSGLKMKFNASKREKIDKFDENKLEQIGKFDEKFDTKQTKFDSKICGRFDENLKYSAQSKLKTQFDTNSNIKKENSNAKNAKFDRNL